MNSTLSNTQWQHLQSLFDRAEQMDKSAADALIASLRQDDALIAETLAAMLSAHRQWQQRTGAAIETLAVAASPSAVGARLGAFTLVKEIGRGGMGTVYLGERADGQVQQQVAIKVLHARNLDDNTRARFQREREILAAFDHPGIARLLDVGESEAGEPYYVMEYLRGLPIDAHCDQHRLSIRERLNLFRGICEAVQYAHGKLILHRDIKPSNIIVDAAGVPKLIDFGIAKPMQLLDALVAEETAAQHRYFSPVNAAPEQIRGESVSVACDVYQLGTLLHELLCGRPIFEWQGSSVSDLERKISAITPDAPSVVAASATEQVVQARALSSRQALARAVSGDLDAIVQRAVRKEPQLRYASVEQLSQDVERHLRDQPVLGRRGERAYRFSRFVKRNRRAIALGTTALLVLSTFTVLSIKQARETAAERDRAVEAYRRAEAVTGFFLDVFRSGDPAAPNRADVSIGVGLERARELLNKTLADEPLVFAQVSMTVADLYRTMGGLGSAEALNVQALRTLESIPSIAPAILMEQMQRTAESLADLEKNVEAEEVLARLRKLEKTHPRDLRLSWPARLLEFRLARLRGEQDTCKRMLDFAADTRRIADVDPRAFARAHIEAVNCPVKDSSQLERRKKAITDAARLIELELDPEDALIAELKSVEIAYLKQSQYDASIRIDAVSHAYKELLERQARVFGSDSRSVANTKLSIGTWLMSEGRFGDAELIMRQAQEFFSTLPGPAANGELSGIAYNLGMIYHLAHKDKRMAGQWFARSIELGNLAFGPNSPSVGQYSADYGNMLRHAGRLHEAEPLLQVARDALPLTSRSGVGARLSLATVMGSRKRWSELRILLSECEGVAPALLEQWGFAKELESLQEWRNAVNGWVDGQADAAG